MNFEDRYGALGRLLHDVAFRAGQAQQAMADIEELLWGDVLEKVPLENPVFVTALPRSGTTILLQLLTNCGHFASHTYRDVPFVLAPWIWNRFSSHFAADDRSVERAHGDGLTVSASSPEAFEEMVWKHFWPERYRESNISPWTEPERRPEFERFLEAHMRKIVALRRGDLPWAEGRTSSESGVRGPDRYVSKNNLNVSRLAAPPRPLRQGTFLIPVRNPVQQAASMCRQHRRFLHIHSQDDFVRRYMEAIGHHEFGRGLRPVNFGGWLDQVGWQGDVEGPNTDEGGADPTGVTFWLRYWVAAYSHVLEHANLGTSDAPPARLLSYAALTSEPEKALARLAEVVDVPAEDLTRLAGHLEPPRTHEVEIEAVPDDLLQKARALHDRLEERAAVKL